MHSLFIEVTSNHWRVLILEPGRLSLHRDGFNRDGRDTVAIIIDQSSPVGDVRDIGGQRTEE